MKSSDEERIPFGIGPGLAMLANLIVVIQYAGKHMAAAVIAVLAVWVVGIAYGRRILHWLVRYRRDLLFLLLGGALASAGIVGALQARTQAPAPCPPLPTPAPCPEVDASAPEPAATPVVTPDASDIVYRTPSGERYHRATCPHVKGKAIRLTLKEAKEMGLTPCKTCHPPP